jgi:type IV pilus assembly protein PilC
MTTVTSRRTRFRYDAVDDQGEVVTGMVRASTRAEARQRLSVHRLSLTNLDDAPGFLNTSVTTERLARRELEGLVAQLAVFAAAGVPLPTALDVIAEETDDRVVRRTATDLADRLTTGQSLAQAVDAHDRVIPHHVRGVLRSAEATGDLTTVLVGLHQHLERQAASRRRLVAAMVYPAVVAALSMVTMVILAVFALPRFSTLFAELGAEPPWVARGTNALVGQVAARWHLVLVGGGVSTAGAMWWLTSSRTRAQRQRCAWRLPVVGRVVRWSHLERTLRVLALVTSSGVTLPAALTVALEVGHHDVMRRRLTMVRDAIMRGEPVMTAFDSSDLLTVSARQVLHVGERTGTLDRQLAVAAEVVAGDVDRRVLRLTALVEPAMIVAVGLVVAAVAVSLVTTMYGLTGHMNT